MNSAAASSVTPPIVSDRVRRRPCTAQMPSARSVSSSCRYTAPVTTPLSLTGMAMELRKADSLKRERNTALPSRARRMSSVGSPASPLS